MTALRSVAWFLLGVTVATPALGQVPTPPPVPPPMIGVAELEAAKALLAQAKGVGKVSRLAPALAALAILWPSETATQEQDYPSWMKARHQLEMKLRQVAADSQRVAEEIEAARRSAGGKGAAKAPGASSRKGSGQPPGDPPCHHIGTSGPGAFGPAGAPPAWILCTYECGGVRVRVTIRGKSASDCERPEQFERARKEAERKRQQTEGR